MEYNKMIEISTEYIKKQLDPSVEIDVALVLGSGLGILADELENAVKIPYDTIPHFPVSTVVGHEGQCVIGELSGKTVLAMQGRFHYYEGYTMKEVTFPVRVFKALNIDKMILTNAAGGVNTSFNPGNLMIINDHINFTFTNPLIGKNYDELGPRFPDTSRIYTKHLIEIAKESAKDIHLDIKEGVYLFNSGPTYETPAEVRMARILGADAVGMSTVPEGITAAHADIEVLGISLITNMAAGILNQPLSHIEVVETANQVKNDFIALVKEIVKRI